MYEEVLNFVPSCAINQGAFVSIIYITKLKIQYKHLKSTALQFLYGYRQANIMDSENKMKISVQY